MNRIIEAQPAVQAVAEEARRARQRWDGYLALVRDLAVEYEAATAARQAAMREALDRGERPDVLPDLEQPVPQEEHTRRVVSRQAEEARFEEARQRAIAAAGDAVTSEARAALDAALAKARPLVEALAPLVAEVRVAQEAVVDVAAARRVRSSTRPSEPPSRESATLVDLIEAVTRGRDLLPSERPRVMVDRDPSMTGRTLGLQASNTRRLPDRAWEPKPAAEPPRIARRGA